MDATTGSRTAVLVCQGRAVAHGRIAPGRFDDPTAEKLLLKDELDGVEEVRSGVPPQGWTPRMRFERLRATAEIMVPRTVAIDDAIRAATNPQAVILGAGLDGRAWRMPELADVTVFEVDHPASQRSKRERAAGLPPANGSVTFVPVDFTTDSLAARLEEAGHRDDRPTTWVWEGVVPYLRRGEVAATVETIAARSAPGSRLLINYQAPTPATTITRVLSVVTGPLSGRSAPMKQEPWRSTWTPASMRELLGRHGFTVTSDNDLLELARELGVNARSRRALRSGRVLVAER